MKYESLLTQAKKDGIDIIEYKFKNENLKGLYIDNVITLNSYIKTNAEKACVLAEELGHHYTSSGDILDQNNIINVRQEKLARGWGYERLVPITSLLESFWAGIKNQHELAEYLEVTEEFLQKALNYYKDKHGSYYKIDNYIIMFDPLAVMEKF